MKIARTIEECRVIRSAVEGTVGFVATMGYLHDGHLALVKASQADNDHTFASIFVNPTQFNNASDLEQYPRDEARDLALLDSAGVNVVFMPSPDEMYPDGFQTYVLVEDVSQGLEGEHRPGHFRGVATVVNKFFNIVQPTRAYFGQKDAQQVTVIRQMVTDLAMPLDVIAHPIIRESDGLAMSSRNARLSEQERASATILHRALVAAQQTYEAGTTHPDDLRLIMQDTLHTEPLAKIDYVSVADATSLKELSHETDAPMLLSLAVFVGDVRLIDNLIVQPA